MANRRDFIQTVFACSTLSSFSLASSSSLKLTNPAQIDATQTLEHFVVDSRYPQSTFSGDAFNNQGISILHTNGDVTDLWNNNFSKSWKNAPMSFAGVTGTDVLFVLETLARDHRMELSYNNILEQTDIKNDQEQVPLHAWLIVPKQTTFIRG